LGLGFMMTELADELGFSESAICASERGYYRPGQDCLDRITRFDQGRASGEESFRRGSTGLLDPTVG